jgi:hypothetical protein
MPSSFEAAASGFVLVLLTTAFNLVLDLLDLLDRNIPAIEQATGLTRPVPPVPCTQDGLTVGIGLWSAREDTSWSCGRTAQAFEMLQWCSTIPIFITNALRAFWRLLVAYTCIVDLRKAIYVKLQHILSSLSLSYFNTNSTAIQPDISTTDGSLNHRQESKNWILCTQFSTWHKISNFMTWIFKPPKLEHHFLRLWSSLFPRHLHLEKINR